MATLRNTLLLIFILSQGIASAQKNDLQLIRETLERHEEKPRLTLLGTEKKWSDRLNPVFLVFRGAMLLYQGVLSEQISAQCVYKTSCSGFSKQLIRDFGLIKGIALTADRLTRCNGKASVEYEEHLYDNASEKLIDEARMYRWNYGY